MNDVPVTSIKMYKLLFLSGLSTIGLNMCVHDDEPVSHPDHITASPLQIGY